MASRYSATSVGKIIFSIYFKVNRAASKAFAVAKCDLVAVQLVLTKMRSEIKRI